MINHYLDTLSVTRPTKGATGRQAWSQSEISPQADLRDIAQYLAPRQSDSEVPPARYLLHDCVHNLKLSNVGQGTVRLSIMHCRAKRDLYNSMNYTSPAGLVYAWDGGPFTAVQQGIAAATSSGVTGAVGFLIPGVDETESPIFNQYFSVLKRTDVLLAVGGTHRLETKVTYDRLLDGSVYGNSELRGVLGVTDFLLFKAEGQTGVINATEPPQITIAACQIAYTENWDYSFIQVANSKQFLNVTDPIGSSGFVANVISGATGSGVAATGLIA